MRVLITGSNGQLGMELMETLSANSLYIVQGHDRETLDITDYSAVFNIATAFKPDVIINGAAYTNVDACETDYTGATSVNHIGAMHVARAANAVGSKIVHISTDFVFDGKKESPYFEYDSTNPLSIYGKTKLAGEWAVRNECKKHFIIRTSWLYGKYGNNFVKTMIKLGKQNDSVGVVIDQVGSPTLATDLVNAILKVLGTEYFGTYHYSNLGSCSWNEFAKEIFKQANMKTEVLPTTSEAFIRPAKRPSYSVMDKMLFSNVFACNISDWVDSLQSFMTVYKE